MQINVLQALHEKFSHPQIKSQMRPQDLAIHWDVMKQLHNLLREYVKRKCPDDPEKVQLLSFTSATDLFDS
jgi:hypothetical protein